MTRRGARAFWIEAPGRGVIRTEPLADAGPDDVVVETLFSGVSRGTERLVFNGLVPASEHERMRAPFQSGTFPAPVKYGYMSVGRVVDGAPALLGREVLCLYPHQTRYVVPAASVHPLPAGLPAARAVVVPYLETAVNGLWDAVPRVGDRVAVVGAGALGLAVGWLCASVPGTRVEIVDIEPARLGAAAALGLDLVEPGMAAGEVDLVIHASGSAAGLRTALGLAGFEASVLELSWYGAGPVSVPLGEAFHARRLCLRSSQVGAVAPAQRARWDTRRRMALALDLARDPALDALVTGEDAFEDLPRVMARLAGETGSGLCHRIRY